ncbi:hypothetical protein SAMN05421837_1262 [Amycolatopsis pretoriensis]|uniref:WXG100 family type VII secretion target n=1 Tax=Amycolatopsis pretoriensis TaxID=218821 RepID=A0A1H5RJJ0_9PSEU|nr:hypothetical protein [Amycolatopsis pretoriensis]SEF38522.1 hypothetical protein SAMN05421837_1262 [Amycolatopsis pretoriensis]
MADKLFIDPEGMRSATQQLTNLAADLKAAQGKLSDVLAQYEGAWGTDEPGEAFEKNYYQKAEKDRKGLGNAAEGMAASARNMQKSAEFMEGLDSSAAQAFDEQPPPSSPPPSESDQ